MTTLTARSIKCSTLLIQAMFPMSPPPCNFKKASVISLLTELVIASKT